MLGEFAGGEDCTGAHGVYSQRFLNEAMLAGFHHGIEMQRTEIRRGCHDNEFRIRGGGLLVGVEAPMAAGGIDLCAAGELLGAVLERIAQGHNLDLVPKNFCGFLKVA